jgi:hypothetical protein
MLRRLLTLVALLTGLAAIAAPAEAHFARAGDVAVELAGSGAAQCHAARLAESEHPADAVLDYKSKAPFCPRPIYRVYIPTVQLGPDRARE